MANTTYFSYLMVIYYHFLQTRNVNCSLSLHWALIDLLGVFWALFDVLCGSFHSWCNEAEPFQRLPFGISQLPSLSAAFSRQLFRSLSSCLSAKPHTFIKTQLASPIVVFLRHTCARLFGLCVLPFFLIFDLVCLKNVTTAKCSWRLCAYIMSGCV